MEPASDHRQDSCGRAGWFRFLLDALPKNSMHPRVWQPTHLTQSTTRGPIRQRTCAAVASPLYRTRMRHRDAESTN